MKNGIKLKTWVLGKRWYTLLFVWMKDNSEHIMPPKNDITVSLINALKDDNVRAIFEEMMENKLKQLTETVQFLVDENHRKSVKIIKINDKLSSANTKIVKLVKKPNHWRRITNVIIWSYQGYRWQITRKLLLLQIVQIIMQLMKIQKLRRNLCWHCASSSLKWTLRLQILVLSIDWVNLDTNSK